MKMQFCTPELPVRDVAKAVDALRQLSFRDAWTYEDSFACMFGGGDIEVFLRKDGDPHPVTLYLKVDDADAFYNHYQQNAEVVTPRSMTHLGVCGSSLCEPLMGIYYASDMGSLLAKTVVSQPKAHRHNMELKLTKEPVTPFAGATVAPEPLSSLTWC